MQALLKKFSIAYWRTPEYNYIRFITTVILGFVLGTLYWKIGHKRFVLLLVMSLLALASHQIKDTRALGIALDQSSGVPAVMSLL